MDRYLRYDEELIVPIIENTPFEKDLEERMNETMQKYPGSTAILVRRHGIYVWGETWEKAKTQWVTSFIATLRFDDNLIFFFSIELNATIIYLELRLKWRKVEWIPAQCRNNDLDILFVHKLAKQGTKQLIKSTNLLENLNENVLSLWSNKFNLNKKNISSDFRFAGWE